MDKKTYKIWSTWPVRLSLSFIAVLLVVSLCADLLVGDSPVALSKYGPQTISEYTKIYQPPGFKETSPDGSHVHWLGTDKFGRDVAARLIYGTRAALGIGIWSTLLSLLIALVLGTASGYFGNDRVKVNLTQLLWVVVSSMIALFYAWYLSLGTKSDGYFGHNHNKLLFYLVISSIIIWPVYFGLGKLRLKRYSLPIDAVVVKVLEVFRSVPTLFLLIALFALIRTPSMTSVILIIGLLGWPGLTRLLRAEIQKVRKEEYVEASQILGLSDIRIIIYHVLPNSVAPVVVALAFAVSGAVLLESTLSFLEIGLPLNTPSWGGLLREARDYFAAWWLAIIPGALIFLTVLSCNILGTKLNDYHSSS